MLKVYLTLLIVTLFGTLSGQSVDFSCGFQHDIHGTEYNIDESRFFVEKYSNETVSRNSSIGAEDTLVIKVKLWLIKKNDGSGLGPSAAARQNLALANQNFFLKRAIKFELCQEASVNSSIYHDLDVTTELDGLKNTYYAKGMINLYITNTVTFTGNTVGGVGYSIGSGSDLSVCNYASSSNSIGYLLFAHELGHCLHLAHTHGKYNWQISECNPTNNNTGLNDAIWCRGAVVLDNNMNIDTNSDQIPDCMQTGDNICDTKAEPQLGSPGLVTNCQYAGSTLDPNGTPYNPQVGNIMSYTPNIHLCNPFFTQGQYDKMRFAIENFGLQLFCETCNTGNTATKRIVTTLEDSKVGSLRWAIACANNSIGSDTIIFSNNLVGNTILLKNRLPDLLSNLVIIGGSSSFGKITLDGNMLTDKYASGLTFNGDNITVKNLKIIGMPQKGIAGWNPCTNATIDNCEIIESGRLLPPYGNGVIFVNSTNVNVKNSIILNTKGNGANFDVNNLTFENNIVGGSDYNGIVLYGGTNGSSITGNKIGFDASLNALKNGYSGILLVEGSTNAQIGGTTSESENVIANHPYNAIALINNSNNCNIKRNKTYCNAWGIYLESGSNNDIASPVINNITSSSSVSGTCPINSEIFLYRTKQGCSACEGFDFLGSVIASGTTWAITLSSPLNNGTKVTATATKNGNTSQYATCKTFICTPPAISVGNKTICAGQTATLTASGATTYQWSNGATGASVTVMPNATTTYTVTGTTAGCASAPAAAQVVVNPVPNVALSGQTICAGQTATLTASGATSYQWSNGATEASITVMPNATTTYTVTGTTVGCASAPAAAQVVVNPIPNVALSSQTICAGQTATLTASGATTYQWSNGTTGASVTVMPNATTTYTVTGTVAGCASAPAVAQVAVNPIPNVALSSQTICAGQTATLTASGATSYQWSNGATGASVTVMPNATTAYTVTGTAAGCASAPAAAQVVVNPIPSVVLSGQTICAGQTATLTASGATSYQWSNGATGASITVMPNVTTTYTVTGTTVGCASAPAAAQVVVNPIPNVALSSQTICANQTATLTASGATSYQWSNGATGASITVMPNATTTYTVTGTTVGCASAPAAAQVVVNPVPNVALSGQTICAGQTATLMASGATTYQWSNGATGASITVMPNATTTYTVTGTTAGCASAPTAAQVVVNPIPNIALSGQTICAGQTATLTASGATTYQWSNGATGASVNVMPNVTTAYTVTGTTVGCTSAPAAAQVVVNPIPNVALSSQTICAGQTATLTASGATTYQWSNGATGASVTVMPNATTAYTVTGTTVGCTSAPAAAQVVVNPIPSVALSSQTICAGQTATLTASGATTYQWSNGATGASVNVMPNATTTYTVTGTTAGCVSAPAAAQIVVNPALNDSISFNGVSLEAFQSDVLYQWIDCNNYKPIIGETNSLFTPLISGSYAVIIKKEVCIDTSICIPIILTKTNENVYKKIKINIFPNPNEGQFSVLTGVHNDFETGIIALTNNLGSIIIQKFIHAGIPLNINISEFPSGVYFLRILIPGMEQTTKIIKL